MRVEKAQSFEARGHEAGKVVQWRWEWWQYEVLAVPRNTGWSRSLEWRLGWGFIKSLGDRQENREGDADCTEGARETELGRSPEPGVPGATLASLSFMKRQEH